MNIIRMTGGMGNQMFQYALYLKLCSMGRKVKFDDVSEYRLSNARPRMLWAFGISYPKADKEEVDEMTDSFLKLSHRIRRKLFGRKSREYHEKVCNYDDQALAEDETYLTGYFQSEKYFKDIEEKVRHTYVFTDKIWDGLLRETVQKIKGYQNQIKNTISVSLHVRRGDYTENEAVYGGICTEEYYKGAIRIILGRFPDAVFFIFSNDVPWVKEWIGRLEQELRMPQGERFVAIEGTTEETGYLDMFLMSCCRHYIIANSSFSWWGAWLGREAGKIVAAPYPWSNTQNYVDIYTKEMIRINAKGELVE